MADSKQITIMYSGGLDSFAMEKLAQYKGYDYNKVWFDIGQAYNHKEEAVIDSAIDVDNRFVEWGAAQSAKGKDETSSGNIYIPGRNAVLTILTASMYEPDEIWMGALKGEDHVRATDKNETFRSKINDLMGYVYFNKDIELKFPLIDMGFNKLTMVEWMLDQGVTAEELHATSSCLSGEDGNCGECVVCVRRWGIFGQLGIPEEYNVDPLESKAAMEHILDIKTNDHYTMDRKCEIVPYAEALGLYDKN